MNRSNKTQEISNGVNSDLSELFNTWTNEFGDRITFMGNRGGSGCYTISIDGKYIKSVGGLNLAKSHISKKRNVKCKWVGSVE